MDVLIIIIVIALLLTGIAGTVIPFIPGVPLVFIGIAAYGWYEGFHLITPKYLAVIASLTVLSMIMDYVSSLLGAKFFGSSKKGTLGALIGTFLGLFFFPPLGIFVGPLAGAVIGEILAGSDVNKAFKVGLGTAAGLFSGMIFNLVLVIGIIISFLIKAF
ncbi:MAG TPA: DUF456 domain-containing protein [Syntrophomonadaceae bacterium]|nr:DUF456 domain-containing protein [Syntrophomonadaceae bacterium]